MTFYPVISRETSLMALIDLHTHSTYSDGTLTPAALVALAKETGLTAIALTDHDTMAGTKEALFQGRTIGVEVIPGVEISASYDGSPIHILGYGLRHNDNKLLNKLEEIQGRRRARNIKIVSKLNLLGIKIDLSEIHRKKGELIGRPHIAQLLVAKGMVKTQEQAFTKFLKKGGLAYAPKNGCNAEEAISMIKEAGGIAVLAHPTSIDPTLATIPDILIKLKKMGLAGIETYYPSHTPKICAALQNLGRKLGLLLTGGSDFHGAVKPGLPLGGNKKSIRVPYPLLQNIKNHLKKIEKDAIT